MLSVMARVKKSTGNMLVARNFETQRNGVDGWALVDFAFTRARTYNHSSMRLSFEWDATKARVNFRKHKVSFEEAKTVFNGPLLITFPDDEHSGSEERFVNIGVSRSQRLLLVVHTEQQTGEEIVFIRIISCRKETASERRTYEEGDR